MTNYRTSGITCQRFSDKNIEMCENSFALESADEKIPALGRLGGIVEKLDSLQVRKQAIDACSNRIGSRKRSAAKFITQMISAQFLLILLYSPIKAQAAPKYQAAKDDPVVVVGTAGSWAGAAAEFGKRGVDSINNFVKLGSPVAPERKAMSGNEADEQSEEWDSYLKTHWLMLLLILAIGFMVGSQR